MTLFTPRDSSLDILSSCPPFFFRVFTECVISAKTTRSSNNIKNDIQTKMKGIFFPLLDQNQLYQTEDNNPGVDITAVSYSVSPAPDLPSFASELMGAEMKMLAAFR